MTSEWRRPWRDLRWGFSAIWLLFLIYPCVAVVTAHLSAFHKALGLTLLAVFAAIYLLACVYLTTAGPNRQHPSQSLLVFRLGTFVALATVGAGLIPLIRGHAFGVTPFLMALGAMTFPFWSAVATVFVLITIAVLLGRWVPDGAVDPGTLIMMVGIGLTMLGIRIIRDRQIEHEASEDRRRELDRQLDVVAERERVARDVHDILGHSLTVITVKSELAQRLVDLDPERAKRELADLNTLSRKALEEVRATVGNLRSPDLMSTLAATRSALDAAGIAASVSTTGRTDDRGDAVFAWVLREAVTNVVRHSAATRCSITVDDHMIEIRDDGRGMNGSAPGNGLRGLDERVRDAGGTLTVDSHGPGTKVRAVLR